MLRQAIFWTVYEAEGDRSIERSMEKTHSLLGLMQGMQERSLTQIHISSELQSRLISGQQNWRDMDIYQDAITQIDKFLDIPIQEWKLASPVAIPVAAEISNTKPTAPARTPSAPASSFVEAIGPREVRIIPPTSDAIGDTLAQQGLLNSQGAEQKRLDDLFVRRNGLSGRDQEQNAGFSERIADTGFTINDKRKFAR